jgi:hypothetical protein
MAASIFLYGMDSAGEKTILLLFAKEYSHTECRYLLRTAFLFGITGIPHNAKSTCNSATSDRTPENSE